MTEAQTPPVAIAAFRQSHPDAHIDRIVLTISNAPQIYGIYYKEGDAPRMWRTMRFTAVLYRGVRISHRAASEGRANLAGAA